MIRALVDGAIAALLAPTCAVCDCVLDRPLDGAVCVECWNRVVPFTAPVCQCCGEALASTRTADVSAGRCRVCSVELGIIRAVRSIGAFDGVLADLVHACKYGRRPSIAVALGRRMREAAATLDDAIDLVVPVPLHQARERARGFNQAERLARGMALPICPALQRRRATPPQVGTSGAERRANVRDAFVLSRHARRVEGQRVALVDDVVTTGATLVAAAAALAQARPRVVVAVTAARAALARR